MGYYFLIVGTMCVVAALWLTARRLPVVWRGRRVRGTIASWERRRDHEHPGGYHFFPHVRYLDNAGHWRELRVTFGYQSERWPVGASFDVRFDPRNPERSYPANPLLMMAGPVGFAVLGAAGALRRHAGFQWPLTLSECMPQPG